METSRAVLLLTLPVGLVMILLIQNWNNTAIFYQLCLAYITGITAGVVLQKYRTPSPG